MRYWEWKRSAKACVKPTETKWVFTKRVNKCNWRIVSKSGNIDAYFRQD